MAERVAQQQSANNAIQSNEFRNGSKLADFSIIANPGSVTRERSFIRTNHHHQQNLNKRRSLAFNHQPTIQQQHQQIRGKPALEIYRPPSK